MTSKVELLACTRRRLRTFNNNLIIIREPMRDQRIRWSCGCAARGLMGWQPVLLQNVGTTEQRTTIRTEIKTIRRTSTRVGNEPSATLTWNRCLFVRQDTSGVAMQNFHRTVFESYTRQESPDGPSEALVNRGSRSSY